MAILGDSPGHYTLDVRCSVHLTIHSSRRRSAARLNSGVIRDEGSMASDLEFCLTVASVAFGFSSAGAWFYASTAKVSTDKMVARRKAKAVRTGETPNLASVSLDGWDMSSTFAAQSRWNAIGAVLAACAVGMQSIAQIVSHV